MRFITPQTKRCALFIAAWALSVSFFFRAEIANHFSVLSGDRYDAVIAIAILEHWSNVLRGLAPFATTNFFFPIQGSLGYNDAYFLTGLMHALIRAFGADPYLASEMVAVVLRAIGFVGSYFALRRILSVPPGFALLGAALVTVANNMTVQALHGQLLTVGFAPVMALLLDEGVRAFVARASGRFIRAAALASLFFGTWLLTSFYTAWFFAMFALLFSAAFYSFLPHKVRQTIHSLAREQFWLAAAALILLLVALAPFLAIYLPKAVETGQHTYLEAYANTPSFLDLFNVGGGNLIFGRLFSPSWSELQAGVAPGLVLMFGAACVWLWRNHAGATATKWVVARAICLATIASYLLILHVGPASLWSVIYVLVPGSHAIRVVSRFQLLLDLPVTAIAMLYLSELSAASSRAVVIVGCAFLLIEEVNINLPLNLHRNSEMEFFASVPAAPPECNVFFVSKARKQGQSGAFVDGVYSHNVDAMFIAETRDLRTPNGFGSFLPPGWNLVDPDRAGYIADVAKFAARYGVKNLCALDLQSKRWTTSSILN